MAEKEYVLGNKAKDLYQFTRQATKPGPDDKVDARDTAKVMRTIAKAKTVEETRDMLNATADRLDNRRKRPFFPKSETFGMIKDLRSAAKEAGELQLPADIPDNHRGQRQRVPGLEGYDAGRGRSRGTDPHILLPSIQRL